MRRATCRCYEHSQDLTCPPVSAPALDPEPRWPGDTPARDSLWWSRRALPERLQAVVAEIESAGGHAHAVPCDMSVEAQVKHASAQIAAIGPMRAAVFNAGIRFPGALPDVTAEQFEANWRNDTYAGYLFAQEAVKACFPTA